MPKKSKSKSSAASEEEILELPTKIYVNANQRICPYINEGKPSTVVDIVGFGDDTNNQLLGADSGDCVDDALKGVNCLDIVCGPNFNLVNEANHNQKYRRVWSWGKVIDRKTPYLNELGMKEVEVRSMVCPIGRDTPHEEIHVIPELWKRQIVQITCGKNHAAALTFEGDVYTWGIYRQHNMDIGMRPGDVDLVDPRPVEEPELVEEVILEHRIVQIASSAQVTYCLAADGTTYKMGGYRHSERINNRLIEGALTPRAVSFPRAKVCAIFANANSDNVFAVTRRGVVYGWGPNNNYQCAKELEAPLTAEQRKKVYEKNQNIPKGDPKEGYGSKHEDSYPEPIICKAIMEVVPPVSPADANEKSDTEPYMGNIRAISSGANHGALVTEDGKLYCWGKNDFGQCGGNDDLYIIPHEVNIPGDAYDVACGSNFTIVLTVDSKVYGFGLGDNGRLGPKAKNGANKKPVQIPTDGDVELIAAGKKHILLGVKAE